MVAMVQPIFDRSHPPDFIIKLNKDTNDRNVGLPVYKLGLFFIIS
jgi:hypothetical protein